MKNRATSFATKHLTVLKASAGSGKTYNLAKIYIDYLLWDRTGKLRKAGGHYHEHMLAITFTNKATQEMKSRIVKELYEMTQGEGGYIGQFMERYGDSRDDIREAAKRALGGLLFGYTNFNVSTIDSFFQSVLRNFAHELDVDYNYEVQLDTDYAVGQALNGFLHDLGTSRGGNTYSRETNWIKKFLQEQMRSGNGEKGADWNMFGSSNRSRLKALAKKINDDAYRDMAAEMTAYLSKKASNGTAELDNFSQLIVRMRDVASIYYCGGIPDRLKASKTYASMAPVSTSPSEFKKLMSGLELAAKNSAFASLLSERKEDSKPSSALSGYTFDDVAEPSSVTKKSGVVKSRCFKNVDKVPLEQLVQIYEFKCRVVAAYLLRQALDKTLDMLWQVGMLSSISRKLAEYRKDNDLILISDTNELISRVLASGTPFVYERVGTWLNHFMIDEFQDTSRSQYANFKPLLHDSLDAGNGNLIIGDEKQSIYRFRGSDPQLLHEQIGRDFGSEYDDSMALDTNYRSADRIVDFNNRFFDAAVGFLTCAGSTMQKLGETYSNRCQKHNAKRSLHPGGNSVPAGLVRVHLHPHTFEMGGQKVISRDYVLDMLPRYVLDLRDRCGFNFGDILILVNIRAEGDKVVSRLLRWNMEHTDSFIGVVSEESLKLVNSPAVQLIVSVLRFVDATQYRLADADDAVSDEDMSSGEMRNRRLSEQMLYEVLHRFFRQVATAAQPDTGGIGYGQMLQDCFDSVKSQLDGLTDEEKDSHYAHALADVLPDSGEMLNLVGLVDKIIDTYNINADAQSTAFLLEFQNQVVDFVGQAASGGTVHEFLRYWDQKKEKLAIPSSDSDNAVRVMTIHKSKGLEAPCVILPFANWTMVHSSFASVDWLAKEQFMGLAALSGQIPEMRQILDRQECIPPLVPVAIQSFMNAVAMFAPMVRDREFALDRYFKSQTEEEIIDNLNKTYVAFTRPCQQLHIFSQSSVDGVEKMSNPSKCSLAGLLSHLLPDIAELAREEFVEAVAADDFENDFGGNTPPVIRAAHSFFLGDLNERCLEHRSQDGAEGEPFCRYEVNSVLSDLKVSLPEVATRRESEGTDLHRVVSLLITGADRDRALRYAEQRHIVQPCGYWNAQRMEQLIDHLLTSDDTALWFQPHNRVYSERPILRFEHDGEVGETCRPDRVVITPDGRTLVIDYKFGSSTGVSLLHRYERQVSRYARLLTRAGLSRVEAYLYMAREEKVHPVQWQRRGD